MGKSIISSVYVGLDMPDDSIDIAVAEAGPCDQRLTRECVLIGLSGLTPTAKPAAAPGCGQVDSSGWRSNRPAGRGQRFALPTARASAYLTTAFHHDIQGTLLEESIVLLLEDTRRRRLQPPMHACFRWNSYVLARKYATKAFACPCPNLCFVFNRFTSSMCLSSPACWRTSIQ